MSNGSLGIPGSIVESLSGGLLFPVLGLEVLLIVAALVDAGSVCWEMVAVSRRRGRAGVEAAAQEARRMLTEDGLERASERIAEVSDTALWKSFARSVGRLPNASRTHLAAVYEETESAASRAEDRSHLLSRVGPVIGLLGALLALGQAIGGTAGDAWSRDVRTGVSALALGLLVWMAGYVAAAVRKRSHDRELADVHYVLETLTGVPVASAARSEGVRRSSAAPVGITDTALLLGAAAVVAAILGFSASAGNLPGTAAAAESDSTTLDALPIADSGDAGTVVGSLLRRPDGSVAWLPGQVATASPTLATESSATAETTAVASPAAKPTASATTTKTKAKEPKNTGSKSDATPEEAESEAVIADINVDDPNVDDPSVDGDLGE
ncbi:MAG: hypothetical protein HY876_08820 [Coriobacteriales bacterium]|nr:hypothetical protein [Coriobacteriales bacterium]